MKGELKEYYCLECDWKETTHKLIDGINCPRCNRTVLSREVDKPSPRLHKTNYKCLKCGNIEKRRFTKDEYKEVIVCSQCLGAAVEVWKAEQYLKQYDDKERLNTIIENAEIQIITMRDYYSKQERNSKKNYILSEDDFNWLIQKVKEVI